MPTECSEEPKKLVCLNPSIDLRFDSDRHKYYLGKIRIVGITEVLKAAGIIERSHFASDYALWRGAAIHKAIELYNNKTLNWTTVHEEIKPFLEAYVDFQVATGFQADGSEEYIYSPIVMVAGRLDIRGRFPDGRKGIIDCKSGSKEHWHAIQLAGQSILLNHTLNTNDNYLRFGLYLRTKRASVFKFDNPSDAGVFLSACSVCAWKRNHGYRT